MSKFYFDEESADRAVSFIEGYITHVKGELAAKPLVLEKWQKDEIIKPLFGYKDKHGLRQYRQVYCEIPRKNGKSSLCAALCLYVLFCDDERGAEIYSAAADRQQAGIVFEIAKQMVLQNPEDASDTKIVNVENAQTSDVLEAINLMADATTKIVLNNEEFQIKAENLVDEIVPPEYKDTLGASIILAEADITGDYEVKRKLTDNLQIKASTKRYGKNMSIFLTGKF